MDIKDILAKVIAGTALSDDEKAFATAYDPASATKADADKAAAAARRGADGKLKEKEAALAAATAELEALRADLAGRPAPTDLDGLRKEADKLKKAIADKDAAFAKLETEKRQLVRGHKLGRILGGLKFVDGIDPDLPRSALERALAEIDDATLDDETATKPVLDAFRARNKALIRDDSGHGSGARPGERQTTTPAGTFTPEQVKAMDPATFLKNRDAIWAASTAKPA